jgi:hypothetical protein
MVRPPLKHAAGPIVGALSAANSASLPAIRQGCRIAQMAPGARVLTWNGKDVPPELLELPAGRYVVEAIEDEAPTLTPQEEAGIETALQSYRSGRVFDASHARKIIDAALGR